MTTTQDGAHDSSRYRGRHRRPGPLGRSRREADQRRVRETLAWFDAVRALPDVDPAERPEGERKVESS